MVCCRSQQQLPPVLLSLAKRLCFPQPTEVEAVKCFLDTLRRPCGVFETSSLFRSHRCRRIIALMVTLMSVMTTAILVAKHHRQVAAALRACAPSAPMSCCVVVHYRGACVLVNRNAACCAVQLIIILCVRCQGQRGQRCGLLQVVCPAP